MNQCTSMKHEHVEYIPEDLQPGMLYISERYATASHLCCCGCRQTVVTPLNPAKWRLTERGGKISLSPSIGNWSFACQSHYWIEGDRVRWAGPMSCSIAGSPRCRAAYGGANTELVVERQGEHRIGRSQIPASAQETDGQVVATLQCE
jgi:hypothetical protein